jgi:hypothetical protein
VRVPPQEAAAALPAPQHPPGPPPRAAAPPSPQACAIVWFHHIKSLEKRKFIVGQARGLGVRGYSKPGFPGGLAGAGVWGGGGRGWGGCCARPALLLLLGGREWGRRMSWEAACAAGVIVAEGPEEVLEEYISSVRGLRWQAMQVRCKERLPAGPGAGTETAWRFQDAAFQELQESGMSDLAEHCSAAGLGDLIMAALKIR